jgi:hypothetical protein
LPAESVADTVIACVPAGVPGVLGVLGVLGALPPPDEELDPPQPESVIKPHVRSSTTRTECMRRR